MNNNDEANHWAQLYVFYQSSIRLFDEYLDLDQMNEDIKIKFESLIRSQGYLL